MSASAYPVRRGWIGGVLLVAWGALYLGLGGARLEGQVVAQWVMAACIALCLRLPDRMLMQLGRMTRFWTGMGLVGITIAVGLIPLPASILGWVAPGVVQARPEMDGYFLATNPEGVVHGLAMWSLYAAMGTGAGVWAVRSRSVRQAPVVAAVCFIVAACFALVHVWFGTPAVLGWVTTSLGSQRPFYAPFVNDTHLATLLLLLLPAALWGVAHRRERSRAVAGASVLLALMVVVLVGANSEGAYLVAVLLIAGGAGAWLRPPLRRMFLVGAVGLVGIYAAISLGYLRSPGRLDSWQAALALVARFPLVGTGIGGFGQEFAAVRGELSYGEWSHLHNDGLEWVVETGLVGVALGLAALIRLVPKTAIQHTRTAPWVLGLGALVAHSLVEFPFHIPSIAATAVLMLGFLHGAYSSTDGTSTNAKSGGLSPRVVRRVLWSILGLQLAFGIWGIRSLAQDWGIRSADTWSTDPETAVSGRRVLGVVAPWRSEILLVDAWQAEADGDPGRAIALASDCVRRFPANDKALRRAALILMRQGELEEADRALEYAVRRNGSDWRNQVAAALLNERMGRGTAVEDWGNAIRSGAPETYLDELWRVLPSGLAWLSVLEEAKNPAGFTMLWAVRLLESGQEAEAMIVFEQADMLRPNTRMGTDPRFIRLLIADGRRDEALMRAQRGLALGGPANLLLPLVAELTAALGSSSEAQEAYRQAVRAQPSVMSAYMAFLIADRGIDEAEVELRNMALVSGPNPWGALAVAFELAGERQFARCRDVLRVGQVAREASLEEPYLRLQTRCAGGADGAQPLAPWYGSSGGEQ